MLDVRRSPLARLTMVATLVLAPAVARAAEPPATRAEAWRRLREEKAGRLHPHVPSGLERFAIRFEDEYLPRFLTPRTGFFPFFGRITSGAGFAVGPGYRHLNVAGGDWVTYGAASIQEYWQFETRLNWDRLARGRGHAAVFGRYFRFPAEDFYGVGPDTVQANRADFDLRQLTIGGEASFRPVPWLVVGGATDYFKPRAGPGGDNNFPNVGDEVPGLGDRHAFVRLEGFADLRTAEPAFNPRRGGRYRAGLTRFADLTGRDDFTRYEVDLQQYASILNERRVFVLRALGSFTDVPSDARLPFYLMRTLGGSHTLRGFPDFRFRDRHLLALQAEYRWEILTALDGVVFYDLGQVAPELEAFRLRDFERDYGVGLRLGSNGGVFLRLDVALGGEGNPPRTWLRFGHVF
jgi:hypothetical protein